MISYAQNAEDVVLARALPGNVGFYVDVGAADPDDASVTRHFSELGWWGVNIEPRAEAAERLRQRRPRDVTLQVAAGAAPGTVELHRVTADPDLSTTSAGQLAVLPEGQRETITVAVPVRTLDDILEEFAPGPIDFLKIDAEGSEHAVLEGIDLERWRPRVVVVEAIAPWSTERTDHLWRHHLERSGYREALFDGVNLFFAPVDDAELLAVLGAPASALDGFIRGFEAAQAAELDFLRARIDVLQRTIDLRSGRHAGMSSTALALPVRLPPPPVPLGPRRLPLRAGASPPAPARLAVVGGPCADWLGGVLARALDAALVRAGHPADVPWSALADRVVVRLDWRRSRLLEQTLQAHQLAAVCPARAGTRPDWWATPATCRVPVEALADDPAGTVTLLLDEAGLTASHPVADVVRELGPPS